MLSVRTGEKLRAISEVARTGRRVKDLRRLMNHPDLWMQAYLNIQGNKGALTRGTTATTMDGYSPERAANLVELIRERRYKPHPVRRVNIPKKGVGKMRPLGLPSADDKLVQEVVRMLLERIYEPFFKDSSHGFRPKRSCHTALRTIQRVWQGTKWLIDIDITGYFNNMNHEVLMALLAKRIEDTQFLDLIRDMLNAGYVEEWQYHRTYSGTPQGGIVSPILANIYLHEFDEFMEQKKREFDRGTERREGKEWHNVTTYLQYYRKKIDTLKGDNTPDAVATRERYEQKVQELLARQKRLPASDPLDPNYRRLHYVRYADDFLIGIIGSQARRAERIRGGESLPGHDAEACHIGGEVWHPPRQGRNDFPRICSANVYERTHAYDSLEKLHESGCSQAQSPQGENPTAHTSNPYERILPAKGLWRL